MEDYIHLFTECIKILPLWSYICTQIGNSELLVEQILLNNVNQNPNLKENCIVLLTKSYIYRTKCLGEQVSLQALKKYVKNYISIEREIVRKNGKLSHHETKWEHFDIVELLNIL